MVKLLRQQKLRVYFNTAFEDKQHVRLIAD